MPEASFSWSPFPAQEPAGVRCRLPSTGPHSSACHSSPLATSSCASQLAHVPGLSATALHSHRENSLSSPAFNDGKFQTKHNYWCLFCDRHIVPMEEVRVNACWLRLPRSFLSRDFLEVSFPRPNSKYRVFLTSAAKPGLAQGTPFCTFLIILYSWVKLLMLSNCFQIISDLQTRPVRHQDRYFTPNFESQGLGRFA